MLNVLQLGYARPVLFAPAARLGDDDGAQACLL